MMRKWCSAAGEMSRNANRLSVSETPVAPSDPSRMRPKTVGLRLYSSRSVGVESRRGIRYGPARPNECVPRAAHLRDTGGVMNAGFGAE
eukprot:5232457-Prymnesium_polylepis.1